ncbi:hypothetical protein C8Q74DRAFT_235573 [Fomes fomentarius]|nr:hypothetical protein C8Q74DRAFT_235573 [Fomes fomentarius]
MLETLTLNPGSPLDPNFVPPTRPPSALSTASDASFFALPTRIIVSTIRRHGQQCLLCGRRDVSELVVVRALLQHGEGADEGQGRDPIAYLKELNLLPHGYTRDDWTNLMTLCRPHAEAYDAGTWRWLPNATLRSQLYSAPKTVSADVQERAHGEGGDADGAGDVAMTDATASEVLPPHHSQSLQTEDGLEVVPPETLVDDGIDGDTRNPEIHFQPLELPSFDVLVFRPESMPPVPGDLNHEAGRRQPVGCVWPEWRTLTLNPYVVFAAALPLLDAGNTDGELGAIVRESLSVAARWNREIAREAEVDSVMQE